MYLANFTYTESKAYTSPNGPDRATRTGPTASSSSFWSRKPSPCSIFLVHNLLRDSSDSIIGSVMQLPVPRSVISQSVHEESPPVTLTEVVRDNSFVSTTCSQPCCSLGERDAVFNSRPDEPGDFCRISDHLEKHNFIKSGSLSSTRTTYTHKRLLSLSLTA